MPRHMRGRRPKPDPNATLYVFKVALAGQKKIWRRIAIRSDQTLDDLHTAIFDAFNRFDEHLYSFFVPAPGSKVRRRLDDGEEYTSPLNIEEAIWYGERKLHNAGRTGIGSLGLTPGRTMRYIFDFGDSWWHEIEVERTDGKPEQERYPKVIEKRGESPPQYPEVEEDLEEDEEDQL